MTSPRMERPIFHHLQHRPQTRTFLSVLACHLLTDIEHRFLQVGIRSSWWTLRYHLNTHHVATCPADDRRARAQHPENGDARAGASRHLRHSSNPGRGDENRSRPGRPGTLVTTTIAKCLKVNDPTQKIAEVRLTRPGRSKILPSGTVWRARISDRVLFGLTLMHLWGRFSAKLSPYIHVVLHF